MLNQGVNNGIKEGDKVLRDAISLLGFDKDGRAKTAYSPLKAKVISIDYNTLVNLIEYEDGRREYVNLIDLKKC